MKRLKKLFLPVIIFIVITSLSFYGCSETYESIHKESTVSGTVIAKNVEQYAHGKHHRNMSTRYVFAFKPDDQINYVNATDVYVSFSTYSTYNVGSRCSFTLQDRDVLRTYDKSTSTEICRFIILILCCIGFTCSLFLLIFIISEL